MGVVGATIAAGVASAAIGAGASALSSSKQSSNVAGNQQQVQNQLMNLQPQFDTALATETGAYAPYSTSGVAAQGAQSDLLGLNGQPAADAAMAKFQSSPGYQFSMQQGLRGVDAGAAAAGMLRRGATLKAEDTYAQGLANQDFQQYYTNLSGLAGSGLTAATGLLNANQDYVANMAGNVQQSNSALTGATNAQNSILGNEASGLSTTANSLFSNPDVQKGITSGINSLFGPSNANYNPAGGLGSTLSTSYSGPGISNPYAGQLFSSGGVF
jgi:hypothetical protein